MDQSFSFNVVLLAISRRLMRPQRFLCFLKVSSSKALMLNNKRNQPSVSLHSFNAISNFESISAMLYP